MTRFARAKGSKASNERVPEKSTPWNVMKKEMERKKQEAEEDKEREKHNKIRQENYDKFLKERAAEVKTEWAEFPDDKPKERMTKKTNKPKKIKREKSEMISKKDVIEMLKPDKEIDAQVKQLTSQIVQVLEKDELKKTKTLRKSKNIDDKAQDSKEYTWTIENDHAPTEVSSKVAPSEIKVVKQKNYKKPLKIKPVIEDNRMETETQNQVQNEQTENSPKQELTKSMKKRLKRKLQLQKADAMADKEKPELPVKNNSNKNEKEFKRKFPDNKNSYEKSNKFPREEKKLKVAKVRDNLVHKRRKPDQGVEKMIFNGVEVEMIKFDGFPVKKEDFERLTSLKKQMISKGIPWSEVRRTLQLERRRAEKALTREKKKVCFQCRKAGHMLSECPELNSQTISTAGSGICFKCGSTEHTHFECKVTRGEEYKFATCFVCREQGHISKQCPDNPRGLYPQGGACKLCGDVTHLRKDCPQLQREKEENAMFLHTISGGNIESLDGDAEADRTANAPATARRNKIIKF